MCNPAVEYIFPHTTVSSTSQETTEEVHINKWLSCSTLVQYRDMGDLPVCLASVGGGCCPHRPRYCREQERETKRERVKTKALSISLTLYRTNTHTPDRKNISFLSCLIHCKNHLEMMGNSSFPVKQKTAGDLLKMQCMSLEETQ